MFSLSHITLKGTQQPRLNDVSLTIESSRTAIVGYSGAGKTSLLNVLSGFEKPDAGVCHFRPSQDDASRRLPFFWVPENGGLWPHLSVEQHLLSVTDSQHRKSEILEGLELQHRRNAVPAELSQGERSRLSLARALASQAAVLIMDEPLSHVDPVRKPAFWTAIRQLTDRDSTRIIFSSHEPETVLRESTWVVCMHEGRVLFNGSTRELYLSPPNRIAGELLGPLNWFEADEVSAFFPELPKQHTGLSVRPEQLQMVQDPASDIELISNPVRSGNWLHITVRQRSLETRQLVATSMGAQSFASGQGVRFVVSEINP